LYFKPWTNIGGLDGHWVLKWRERRDEQSNPNYGFEKKWAEYLNRWGGLETMPIE